MMEEKEMGEFTSNDRKATLISAIINTIVIVVFICLRSNHLTLGKIIRYLIYSFVFVYCIYLLPHFIKMIFLNTDEREEIKTKIKQLKNEYEYITDEKYEE